MSMLSELLMEFKDYCIAVQYLYGQLAIDCGEPDGWYSMAIVDEDMVSTGGHDAPIKAVVECIKLLKTKRGY